MIKTDLKSYINTQIPKDYQSLVRCHVKRERGGVTKAFVTTFYFYFDGPNEPDHVNIDIDWFLFNLFSFYSQRHFF